MTVVSTTIPPWFIFGWWNQTNSGLSPCRGGHYAAATVHCHSAATATLRGVVVHAKIVSQFVCQSHGSTQWVVRVILQRGWGRGQGITKHESVPAMCNLPERDFNWIKIKVKWQKEKKKNRTNIKFKQDIFEAAVSVPDPPLLLLILLMEPRNIICHPNSPQTQSYKRSTAGSSGNLPPRNNDRLTGRDGAKCSERRKRWIRL